MGPYAFFFKNEYSYLPNRFVAADISDFYTERLIIGSNATIPKLLGFYAVANNISEFINLNFAVRMPFSLGRGAIYANKFNKLQSVIADNVLIASI